MVNLKSRTVKKMTQPDAIVTPVYEQWLSSNPDAPLSKDALDFLVDRLFEMHSNPSGRDREGHLSASSLYTCQRQQVYRVTRAPAEERHISSRLAAIFQDGHYRHLRWQANLISCGAMLEGESPASQETGGVMLRGTLDGMGDPRINGGEAFGIEIKGANNFTFKRVVDTGKPTGEHLQQVYSYMVMSGLKVFSVIYDNKETQDYYECVVRWDESVADDVRARINNIVYNVNSDTLPERLDTCLEHKFPYTSCPYRDVCLPGGQP